MVQQVMEPFRRLATRWQDGRNGVQYCGVPVPGDHATSPAGATIESPPVVGEIVSEGLHVRLRRHVPSNQASFQRWYADEEIAYLLRHDLQPLDDFQSSRYFEAVILPLSASGLCFAIHETGSNQLIGTTALTDIQGTLRRSALFRIVIGEKEYWGHGFGTEATRLVIAHAFENLGLHEIRLEVFRHNPRAIASYQRVGFAKTGEHREWVASQGVELLVDEMIIDRDMIDLPLDLERLEWERFDLFESRASYGIAEIGPIDGD